MPSPANDRSSDKREPRDGPWNAFAQTHELKDARIVAVLDEDGGAIVETHPLLEIHEGRMETYSTDGNGQSTSTLDYGLAFSPKSDRVGDTHTGYPASIVIRGTADNGRLMEIRGRGFIGQDELGQLDGMFHEVPSVYVPSEEDLRQHIEEAAQRYGGAPHGEFVLATYGRAQGWS